MNGDEIVTFPQRGAEASHPTYEEMEAWLDGRADRIDRELVEGHMALCARCAAELGDLRRVRESITPQRKWWIGAAAAAAVIAIVLTMFPDSKPTPETVATTATQAASPAEIRPAPAPPTQTEPAVRTLAKPAIVATLVRAHGTLRGATESPKLLQLAQPVATVVLDQRPHFRWSAARGASEYTVAVADHATGAGAASGSTRGTWWQPDDPLPRGRTYSWQVTAHVGDDRITMPRPSDPEALFHVASTATALEIEALPAGHHLERGIALAERGALDDAERELKRAAEEGNPEAGLLLNEVQSWRHQ